MNRFLVAADGPDRPGIVAAFTGALAVKGCNLEDTSMTKLGGRFVMLLIVVADAGTTESQLFELLNDETSSLELNIEVEALGPNADAPSATQTEGTRWTVSVYGADHPGIVAAVTRKLADVGANIEDLSTRVIGSELPKTYTMLIDVTLPVTVVEHDFVADLERLGGELGVSCRARAVDADSF